MATGPAANAEPIPANNKANWSILRVNEFIVLVCVLLKLNICVFEDKER